MEWKRRSWSGVVVLAGLAVLTAVALVLHGERPTPPPALPDARQTFLAELSGARGRAVRDARAAAAVGRFGFHSGSLGEAQMEGRFPGFENCRVPGAMTVTDLVGVDERKEALRSVYGETYNLEIVRIHPRAVIENCAPPRRGERPARALGGNDTRFAQLAHLRNPPAYVDYYICAARATAGDGTVEFNLTIGPVGDQGPIHAEWSSRDPLSLSPEPVIRGIWNVDSDAGDWIATGGISLNWEGYPPLGPRGSKVSLAFRDPDGRAVPVRIGHGDFSERHAFVLIDWPALRRAAAPHGVYAILLAPDGREALTYPISVGMLDQVERALRETAAQAVADAGDRQHRCQHITGS
jgi:hypothetical protein